MDEPGDRLKQARLAAGFKSIAAAAEAKGFHKQNLGDHEAGRRGIKPEHAEQYARAFKVSPEWILLGVDTKKRPTIQVVGYVGAGGTVAFVDSYEKGGGLDEIDAPPDCPAGAVAARVKGTSMFPVYNEGDIIVWAERRADIGNFIGQRCVVWTADGRVLIKTIAPGTTRDLFTLVSFNAPSESDVVIEYCARILWIKPK